MNLRLSVAYLKAVSGHIDESLALYKILISENEKDETPLVNYIAILIATGRNELAEENLAVLKEKFPESTHISDFEDALK
ncbi:MAG: hypothetical protein IKI31_07615, partial [Treponema sp.]|nr:hypothetical protein [Treponema sp.]